MPSHSFVCFQRVGLPLGDFKQSNFHRHLGASSKIVLHLASRRSLKRGAIEYGFSQAYVVKQLSKSNRDLFKNHSVIEPLIKQTYFRSKLER